MQKMMFYSVKAMFLPLKTYASAFSKLFFDQINESFSVDEKC